MSGLIKGVHHVSMKCENAEMYQKAIAFYRDVLELPVARDWGSGIMLDAGNSMIEIFDSGMTQDRTGSINHFAFAVTDTDAYVARVSEAGYAITVAPKDIVVPATPPYPARIAFCVGPTGEEIEFFCEKK